MDEIDSLESRGKLTGGPPYVAVQRVLFALFLFRYLLGKLKPRTFFDMDTARYLGHVCLHWT